MMPRRSALMALAAGAAALALPRGALGAPPIVFRDVNCKTDGAEYARRKLAEEALPDLFTQLVGMGLPEGGAALWAEASRLQRDRRVAKYAVLGLRGGWAFGPVTGWIVTANALDEDAARRLMFLTMASGADYAFVDAEVAEREGRWCDFVVAWGDEVAYAKRRVAERYGR